MFMLIKNVEKPKLPKLVWALRKQFGPETLAPTLGKKRPKDRITAMLTCSLTGEKLPVLFIHKFENPRPLKGIAKNTLPVWL
jgi:hypothetical protein